MKPATQLTKEMLEVARRRTARTVIRLGKNNAERDLLLDILGLTYEEASPVSNPGADGLPSAAQNGAGSTGTTIVLAAIEPAVSGHRSGSGSAKHRCRKCEQVKPAGDFYTGRATCKKCHQQQNTDAQRRRYASRPKGKREAPRRPRISPPAKECSRCRQVKPASEFHADHRRPDGLTSACMACVARRRAELQLKAAP